MSSRRRRVDRFRPLGKIGALALVAGACASVVSNPEEPVVDHGPGCSLRFGDPATSPYILPFREGRTYRMFQGYCPPDPTWGHSGWYAYDFDFMIGDTILASRAGRVIFVRNDQPDIGGRCGVNGENMVIIMHADGTAMHYAHLTTHGAFVRQGDSVTQGEPIGLSGNSGCSSGPHLHVGLYRDTHDYSHSASLPVNYRNAIGPLDGNGGLIQGAAYTAGPPDAPVAPGLR